MGLFSRKSSTQSSTLTPAASSDQPEKKPFYAKYQEFKRGPSTSKLSDEDLKKYTGMDRAQLDKFAATTPGVAGGQAAGSITAGGTSGFGLAGGAGEGLGGWGPGAGKTPKER